jgi:hypothetical protein
VSSVKEATGAGHNPCFESPSKHLCHLRGTAALGENYGPPRKESLGGSPRKAQPGLTEVVDRTQRSAPTLKMMPPLSDSSTSNVRARCWEVALSSPRSRISLPVVPSRAGEQTVDSSVALCFSSRAQNARSPKQQVLDTDASTLVTRRALSEAALTTILMCVSPPEVEMPQGRLVYFVRDGTTSQAPLRPLSDDMLAQSSKVHGEELQDLMTTGSFL